MSKSRRVTRKKRGGFSLNPFAKKINQRPLPLYYNMNVPTNTASSIPMVKTKQNWMKNKSRKAMNLVRTGAQSLGRAAAGILKKQ